MPGIDFSSIGGKSVQPPVQGPIDFSSIGGKPVGQTQPPAQQATQQAAPPASPDSGVWAGVKRNTVGMVAGLYHAFTDPPTEQEQAALAPKTVDIGNGQTFTPPPTSLAYLRLIGSPREALSKQGVDEQTAAKDLLTRGNIWQAANQYASGAVDRGLANIPMFGPWLNGVARRYERGDASGAATDVAAAVMYANAPEIAKATGLPGRISNALKSSAQTNYQDVLNPTKVTTKYQTQQIMPQLLEEKPIALTRAGLAEKAGAQAEAAGQQVEQAVSNLSGSMKTQPVINGLENLRKSYQVNGVSLRPEVDSAIDAAQSQLRAVSQPGPVTGQGPGEAQIPYQDVVKARRILDDAVAEVGGYQGRPLSDTSMANIRKATANSLRSELGQASPDLAAVNAKFHFWSTLNDVLEQTIQRKTGQVNALPKMETVIAGAGGLARSGLSGAVGYAGAINVLGKLVRSTAWRTVSAAAKANIADAIAGGRFDTAIDLMGKAGVAAQSVSAQTATPFIAAPVGTAAAESSSQPKGSLSEMR